MLAYRLLQAQTQPEFQEIPEPHAGAGPAEPWRDGLLKSGLPIHLVNHLAAMADLHRAGRYDQISDDVLALTGQGPLSVQEVVRKNAATFTAAAKSA